MHLGCYTTGPDRSCTSRPETTALSNRAHHHAPAGPHHHRREPDPTKSPRRAHHTPHPGRAAPDCALPSTDAAASATTQAVATSTRGTPSSSSRGRRPGPLAQAAPRPTTVDVTPDRPPCHTRAAARWGSPATAIHATGFARPYHTTVARGEDGEEGRLAAGFGASACVALEEQRWGRVGFPGFSGVYLCEHTFNCARYYFAGLLRLCSPRVLTQRGR